MAVAVTKNHSRLKKPTGSNPVGFIFYDFKLLSVRLAVPAEHAAFHVGGINALVI